MITLATNTALDGRRPWFLARFFARLGTFLVAYVDAKSHSDQVMKLTALSDAQLAERGLTRDTIVQHIFSDKLYL